MFKTFRKHLALKNYQYEITTGLYMLEPWEKALFTLFTYATVFYLPEQMAYFASRLSEYTSVYH
ncbi:9581_t:CDS:2 [Funneliformis mosseae]|uniref:9581_t:CDS:1 n=1 Tax=Funneliformis mosseae TaxID=27381 RepID=A0A9N8WI86_FUNMO|nr:9581_t:CDS:2 [Funneliformis mosseae]